MFKRRKERPKGYNYDLTTFVVARKRLLEEMMCYYLDPEDEAAIKNVKRLEPRWNGNGDGGREEDYKGRRIKRFFCVCM